MGVAFVSVHPAEATAYGVPFLQIHRNSCANVIPLSRGKAIARNLLKMGTLRSAQPAASAGCLAATLWSSRHSRG